MIFYNLGVCGPSVEALGDWNVHQGTEEPCSEIDGEGSFHRGMPLFLPLGFPLIEFPPLPQAYVRDLEEQLKQDDESTLTSKSIGFLKREITHYKDAETHSAQSIADLEV